MQQQCTIQTEPWMCSMTDYMSHFVKNPYDMIENIQFYDIWLICSNCSGGWQLNMSFVENKSWKISSSSSSWLIHIRPCIIISHSLSANCSRGWQMKETVINLILPNLTNYIASNALQSPCLIIIHSSTQYYFTLKLLLWYKCDVTNFLISHASGSIIIWT